MTEGYFAPAASASGIHVQLQREYEKNANDSTNATRIREAYFDLRNRRKYLKKMKYQSADEKVGFDENSAFVGFDKSSAFDKSIGFDKSLGFENSIAFNKNVTVVLPVASASGCHVQMWKEFYKSNDFYKSKGLSKN